MRRVILTLMILYSLVATMPGAHSQELFVTVEGPEIMPVGGTTQFNVSAFGGPAEKGGTYNISAFLKGSNISGASPRVGDSYKNQSTDPNWIINVTVPNYAQTMIFVVNVTSDFGNESEYERIEMKIRIVGPIVLSAEISNPLEYELKQVPVDFYVKAPGQTNDRLVGSSTIESIAPGRSEFASYDWIIADPPPGEYRLTVVVDLDRDGVINEHSGDSMAISYFYVGGGVSYLSYALAVIFILLIVLSLIWLLTKPRRRP